MQYTADYGLVTVQTDLNYQSHFIIM